MYNNKHITMTIFDEKLNKLVKEFLNDTLKTSSVEPSFVSFQDFLKQHRINKTSFGEIIGVTGSTITKYIDEPGNLKLTQVKRLAEATNTDVTSLINNLTK